MSLAPEPPALTGTLTAALRAPAREAPVSGIVEIMKYGRARGGVMGLWAGEGDTPTPAFIIEAANRGLAAGETFYTWQRGIPDLREALARYHTRLYGRAFSADEFYVTGSGMQAIQITLAMTATEGSEVIIPTPAWPNAAGATGLIGARPVEVPMQFGNAGWALDLERIAAAINDRTRVIILVTPSNPTGWTASRDDLHAVLALARQHGLWIVADETYARFWYGDGRRAPSFLDIMAPDDRILFVNTFSKNWCMTGWRMGWIVAHPSLGQVVENLIQYSTSGVAQFMQRAGVVALDQGEDFVTQQVARARASRDIACDILGRTGRCRFTPPQGAFYLFFTVDGESDSEKLARRLVDEAQVGLAPGRAFGKGGEHFLRLCFARDPEQIRDACERIARVL
ncbi:pyridoxal phosphate-dependent aminotransferase [Pseudorhodoplanes sp.]|uniref:pyridoxal phosphate-dependent aminotransferase n=1 Tax=Pseudorhodoplanes sp. TaxID=1934341 RepID=UPI0039C9B4E1